MASGSMSTMPVPSNRPSSIILGRSSHGERRGDSRARQEKRPIPARWTSNSRTVARIGRSTRRPSLNKVAGDRRAASVEPAFKNGEMHKRQPGLGNGDEAGMRFLSRSGRKILRPMRCHRMFSPLLFGKKCPDQRDGSLAGQFPDGAVRFCDVTQVVTEGHVQKRMAW